MLTRKLLALVFPEGVLLVAAVALVHWGASAHAATAIVRYYPPMVLGAGALLAWRFQRGRLLLALAGLALADRAMLWLAPPDSGAPYAGTVVVRVVAMLVPASLAMLAWLLVFGMKPLPAFAVAIAFPIVMHLAFYKILRVPLPWGVLTNVVFP